MHDARSATLPGMVLRVALLTLPALLLFTATVLPLALLLTHVPGGATELGDNLLLAVLCGLVIWLFLAVFHIRTESVHLPVPDRKTFVQRVTLVLQELGYEVARPGEDRLVSRPGFRAMLLGGGVRVQVEGTTARVTGPKLFVEILRRRVRLQSFIERAQKPLREDRHRPAERLLKRVQISLRLEGGRAPAFHEQVMAALNGEGAQVVCELHIMAQSEEGLRETTIEALRDRLQEHGVAADIRKDFPQWEISSANLDARFGALPPSP
jgi:hypothetical protein